LSWFAGRRRGADRDGEPKGEDQQDAEHQSDAKNDSDEAERAKAGEQVRGLIRRAREDGTDGLEVEELDRLGPTMLANLDRAQDINLKREYARNLLRLMVAQVVLVNGIFVAYAWAGKGWNLESGVVQVWIGATVVQVVGITAIVTRSLFPNRDGK